MAVETTAVFLHKNPLEKTIVWEKRKVENDSKHRTRPQNTVGKVDTIIISDKDEYHSDYCVIAAATKRASVPNARQPVLVADRDTRLRLSSPATNRTFNEFVKRYTGGSTSQGVITSQPRPSHTVSGRMQSIPMCRSDVLQSKHREDDDIKLFCCNQDVDFLIDNATCMCGVKAALYHCSKDSYDEGRLSEHPCTCGRPRKSCVGRWGCLAACSIFLPCLLCYLPLKGCSGICVCYKRQNSARKRRQRTPKDPSWQSS